MIRDIQNWDGKQILKCGFSPAQTNIPWKTTGIVVKKPIRVGRLRAVPWPSCHPLSRFHLIVVAALRMAPKSEVEGNADTCAEKC
jgi:hypothetical protein